MRKILILGLTLALCTSTLFAAESKKKKSAEEMQKAEMEAWMKAATPGEYHKKLDTMVGTWSATVKSWMQPGAPPMESTGTSENQWILGGRWVESKFTGSFMGQPYTGIGYTGYDNIKKRYIGTWMDSMSTSVMMSTGKAGSGNTYTFTATMPDVMTGKTTTMTEKVKIIDHDHHVFEMWGPGRDGKVYKMMEITYSRKK